MHPLERVRQISKAMRALNFIIAFAFEINLTGGNNHNREIIVITSEPSEQMEALQLLRLSLRLCSFLLCNNFVS